MQQRLVATMIVAWIPLFGCSSTVDPNSGEFEENGDHPNPTGPGDGGFTPDIVPVEMSPDAFWANDPPAMCGSHSLAKVPGGTPECPDDKNKAGCPCLKEGASAPCWPGLRKNRALGQCKDGETKCIRTGENDLTWGACVGAVLPTPGATTGKESCRGFTSGRWEIANTAPCFLGPKTGPFSGAVSTIPTYGTDGKATNFACPADLKQPSTSWSKTTLKTDTAGHFKLCYTLKAGNSKAPVASDCVVTKQCTEGDYKEANVTQTWSDLPPWSTSDGTCTTKFVVTGGYGEMSVEGESAECDRLDKVFAVIPYCPLACHDTPTGPGCASCGPGAGGSF